jgi:hypothetical protein
MPTIVAIQILDLEIFQVLKTSTGCNFEPLFDLFLN